MLPPRERAFVHELTYGVARLRGRLDHLLACKLHRGLDDLQPRVHEILRLGAYQLLYLDGIPAYAAISATPRMVSKRTGSAAPVASWKSTDPVSWRSASTWIAPMLSRASS